MLANERVHIFGESAELNGSVVHAPHNPLALYQNAVLSTSDLSYDRNTSTIEAKGAVNIFKSSQYHVKSNYASIDLNKETELLKPYFMIDHETQMWMSTLTAQGCKNLINLEDGLVSGCDSADPLWKIRFSSADYDTDDKWVNLYNPRLEVGDYTFFYFPYIGYPTDNKRRSGLLIPSFGISNAEGFYYEQPIYFAPHNWWDIELRPQIRTDRGSGLYTDLRFVDTFSSQGSINIGYFRENNGYAEEYNLANQTHFGYGLHYRHNAPLREWFNSSLKGESGLYIDGMWMNDVDYLNLKHHDETENVTDNQVMSRLNMYYGSDQNFLALYFKHYQYLDENPAYKDTIQTLPTFHYHRYLESLFQDHLLWNADMMATHFYRPDGIRALQGDLNIPIMYQETFFDNFIDFSYTLNGSYRAIGFFGEPLGTDTGDYTNGSYAQLDHKISFSTSLVKPYGDSVHTIAPFVNYTFAGNRYYNGYFDTYHNNDACGSSNNSAVCDYYDLSESSDQLSLGVNNYVIRNGNQIFMDRLTQGVQYNDRQSYYGELQNELEWRVDSSISFYNQTSYNHDRKRITKEQNSLRYNDSLVSAHLSHYYTDELNNASPVYTSYWTADAQYRYERYKFFGSIAYDYQEEIMKRSEMGFLYSQRCLDFGIRYVQNRRPILTNNSINDTVNDSYVFLTIVLKPIGGTEFNYKLTN